MSGFEYFGLGLEEAYGFGISLIEELNDGFFWRVEDRDDRELMEMRSSDKQSTTELFISQGFERCR